MKKLNYLLIAISIFYGSCNSGTTNDKPIDTPTTGHITIGTDETLFPLASSEVKSFETLCPKANIDIKSGVESDIYTQLLGFGYIGYLPFHHNKFLCCFLFGIQYII